MRLIVFLLLTITILTSVSAICNSGQIDINSASLEDLDKLSGIGPIKAQAIIDARTFSSVNDLINVVGIGEITLEKIKAQGLACVKDEIENNESNGGEENNGGEIINNTSTASSENNSNSVLISSNYSSSKNEPSIIILGSSIDNETTNLQNSKDINTEKNSEFLNKDKTAMYGFFVFSLLLGILLIMRRKSKYQNDI